ncbi:hypothetical protein IX332_000024 [Porphyromonas levii]|uniref:Uncharacterized protein n=1 Tax=Porphyromonas levii TaxID=28114 RepID=A0A4Y8WNU7_9PORP|nr:fimbria major subunit [Porphyromonas levii]MBR8728721.1 hypothetical protein [Porphyromonas levii]MBR8758928.1 hypothetical protein [Porphyromonas levii]MBR8765151.1 hypothetical protein [Porphyromonas levii]TFH94533.1 hypothetical protein E4P47_07070 [Porphyromonas levii]TFH97483.1 hypothetical protein E4P48_01535 [Porphyromonas levii]
MKTHLLCAIALLFLLLGCNKRVELGGTPDPTDGRGTVEVSFGGSMNSFSQKGTRAYPTDAQAERKLRVSFSGLRIVFYSVNVTDPKQPDKVVYAFDKDISADKGEFSGGDLDISTTTTDDGLAFKVRGSERIKADNYIVYVFATVNSELKAATAVGQPFSELKKPMNYLDEEDIHKNYLQKSHYVSEPITVTKELFGDNAVAKVYTLPTAKLSAINALASVAWTPKVNDPAMEILDENLQFYPDVQSRKYLLFPEYDKHIEETLKLKYPIDANYTGFASKGIDELASEFIYRTKLTTTTIKNNYTTDPEVPNVYRTIPENTLASSESRSNTVTRLIIRVRMIPKTIKEKLTPDQLKDKGLSWVNYHGTYYEAKAFLALYKKAMANRSQSEEDKRLIEAANRFLVNGNLPSADVEEGGYEGNDVQYFHRCYTYYALPITHFTPAQLNGNINNGGYFGVVRNYHYKFEIKSMAGLGKASYTAFPYDTDLLGEHATKQDQILSDMGVITNIVDELY